MGLDIEFVTVHKSDEREPMPDGFIERFQFRHRFLSALTDIEYETVCVCGYCKLLNFPLDGSHCESPSGMRPLDFEAFRNKLKKFDIYDAPMCKEWVDYLERNPKVFVTFDY